MRLSVKHTPEQLAVLETIQTTLSREQKQVLYHVFTVPKTNLIRNNEENLAKDNLVYHLGIAQCGHTQDYDLSQVLDVKPKIDDPDIRPPWNGENGNKP